LSFIQKVVEPAAEKDISNIFVVVLGISVVFIGLICIILLCKILSAVCSLSKGKKDNAVTATPAVSTATVASQQIENRQEIIAAVSAAVAEELGTDISAIRILSFKKI